MWVAAIIAVVGLLAVALFTQLSGVRLGGVIVVPVLALYSLVNVFALPLFLLSFVAAFVGFWVIEHRTLLFGHITVVLTAFVGGLVPLLVIPLTVWLTDPDPTRFRDIIFFGSILPGIAAYNVHQLDWRRRAEDLGLAVALFVLLAAIGLLLVNPEVAARYGRLTPPLLFSEAADVAAWRGATVADVPTAVIPRAVVLVPCLVGIGGAEFVRDRLGLRLGIVMVPLLAIFVYYDRWVLPVLVGSFVVSMLVVELVHRRTLLYGRVLLGLAAAVGVLTALPLAAGLPVSRGFSAFFTGMFGGFTAYNVHVTDADDWPLLSATGAALFGASFVLVTVVTPFVGGGDPFWRTGGLVLAVAAVLVLVGGGLAWRIVRRSRRHEARVLASMQSATMGEIAPGEGGER